MSTAAASGGRPPALCPRPRRRGRDAARVSGVDRATARGAGHRHAPLSVPLHGAARGPTGSARGRGGDGARGGSGGRTRRAGTAARRGRQVVRRAYDVHGSDGGAAPWRAGARVPRLPTASSRATGRQARGASGAGADPDAVSPGGPGRVRRPDAVAPSGAATRRAGHAASCGGRRSLVSRAQAVRQDGCRSDGRARRSDRRLDREATNLPQPPLTSTNLHNLPYGQLLWIVKTEPSTYSFDDLARQKTAV